MRIPPRAKLLLLAVAIGAVAGLAIGLLLLGAVVFFWDGASARTDFWYASAILLALTIAGGAFHGSQAFTES